MISMDGSAIVCGYSTSVGNTTTMGFAQFSAVTGKMNHVVGLVHFEGEAPGQGVTADVLQQRRAGPGGADPAQQGAEPVGQVAGPVGEVGILH
jgi:hypothetical protein